MSTHIQMMLFVNFLFLITAEAKFSYPHFSNFSIGISLYGDAHFDGDSVILLKEKTPTWGAIVHDESFSLVREKRKCESFKTRFTFSIRTPTNPRSYNEGFSFFVSPKNFSSSSAGVFGLPTSDFVSVTFDSRTVSNPTVDAGESIIAFVAGSLKPIGQANPSFFGLDLLNGNSIHCWIEYYSGHSSISVNSLHVFLSSSMQKPDKAVLVVSVDLCQFFMDYRVLYAGIASSGFVQGSPEAPVIPTEVPRIYNWAFETFEDETRSTESFLLSYVLAVVLAVSLTAVAFLSYKLFIVKKNTTPSIEMNDLPSRRSSEPLMGEFNGEPRVDERRITVFATPSPSNRSCEPLMGLSNGEQRNSEPGMDDRMITVFATPSPSQRYCEPLMGESSGSVQHMVPNKFEKVARVQPKRTRNPPAYLHQLYVTNFSDDSESSTEGPEISEDD